MNTTAAPKTHTVKVHNWPSLAGDQSEQERAFKDRDAIRRAAEEYAYRWGYSVIRIVDCWDRLLDAYPLDTRRFAVHEGQRVEFPSKSVPGPDGSRYGTVVAIDGSRVRVEYRFKHGGESEKWVSKRVVRPARS